MSFELRDYQKKAIEMVRASIAKGNRNVLLALATGAGKTIIVSEIMRRIWDRGGRSIFFAHRRELVEQTSKRFEQYGIDNTILMAGHETDFNSKVVIGSVQTWESRAEWLDREYTVAIFDEAHIGVARQHRIIEDISKSNPDLIVIGVTATPTSGGKVGMGYIYDDLVQPISMSELIEQGFLIEPHYYLMQPVDFNPREEIGLNSTGEYDAAEVEKWSRRSKLYGHVVENWLQNFYGKRTIVFARTVRQSIFIAEEFGKRGVPFAHIDFSTPEKDRRQIIEAFRRGDIIGLTNVDIFSEGFDVPDAEVGVLATPIRSPARYIQRVGRIMRPAPGKDAAYVVDHGGVLWEHGPVTRYQYWVLEPSRGEKANPLRAVKVQKERERRCPVCGKTFKAGNKVCPECGYDFHHIPPGFDIPAIPAVMVEYRQYLHNVNTGKLNECRRYSLPYGYDMERLWRELLGYWKKTQDRKPPKKPWKKGFVDILFYAVTCTCAQEALGWGRWQMEPAEPGEVITRIIRWYGSLKSKGYFSWKKFPCWRDK